MRDLTDREQNERVLTRAGELTGLDATELDRMERALLTPDAIVAADPIELEALRCARSRQVLNATVEEAPDEIPPLRISVVWAMYGETSRIRPADLDNPHGEDFLRMKVAQIEWLTDGLPVQWDFVAVDDGCPDRPDSATAAAEIASAGGWEAKVRVARLADAIGGATGDRGEGHLNPALAALSSTGDSRKGGSILHGMALAVAEDRPPGRHAVLYTDADLSANLAQAGLLVAPIFRGEAAAVAGQRYGLDGAVLVKEQGASVEPISTGGKPDKMIILFRHFVRAGLIPDLAHVLDTQAGFKAFDAATVRPVLAEMRSFDETFDVELLIRLTQHIGPMAAISDEVPGLDVAPIVFVEDFAQTNFPSVDPGQRHLDMIGQLVAVYDSLVAPYRPAEGDTAELLALCRALDLDRYITIIERLRAQDESRAAAGGPDALFDSRWPVSTLTG